MKKILSVVLASLAVAAIADPSYSPQIGVTALSLSQKNNIIPVQFTSLTNGNVTAAALVCTNNIPVNSHLYVYDATSGYSAWTLSASGWQALDTASTADGISAGVPADGQTLVAGTAIWLSFPAERTVTVSIYGKVTNSYSVEIAEGTKASPKNYLLCNPTGTEASLSAKFTGTPAVGDTIRLIGDGSAATYTYGGSAGWYKILPNTKPTQSPLPTIAGHQGFWYMSKGGTGTFAW